MLLKTGQREVLSICLLLGISCTSALARVDNNWSQQRRPNITVTQNQRGQAGYRPANVSYQQPLVHNQTHGHSYNNQHQQWQQQQNNNRTQYNQPGYRPAINNPAQQNPGYVPQNTLNNTRPSYPQPSAPQVPVYPALPNNKPAIPINTWSPAANQTLIYPPLPNKDLPSAPPTVGINGIPLAPLQPAPQGTQGPQNWHSGGQAVLSYGPGHYPSPAGHTNKNPPTHQGSSNPYANMFN